MADKNLLLNKKNNKDEYVDELFDTKHKYFIRG